ncbi:MAG: methyltetrahydrofolate cobalamin methyltransferase [Gracilibacteraceae bacterium]|jgi:5-methyltetrahydrofolate--homocysteine methyltransferase|nr:methyltetrahydrofolate cobalamin methyltransferase [Gracilibacteraceae bacterium]
MIIIGEKINGTIPSVGKAIAARDEEFIRNLAVREAEGGANYIDVCASTAPEIELETLKWLMDIVQDAVETPLSIDSPNVKTILEALPYAKKPGMINSVSEEAGKADLLFPEIAGTEWRVVALTCDNNGLPNDPNIKFDIGKTLIEKAKKFGIALDRLFIDPLVTTIGTNSQSLLSFSQAAREIKAAYPEVHIVSGLSNISFGMPLRKYINQAFLVLAMGAGMDAAIIDPTSVDMRTSIYCSELLLGLDRNAKNYLKANRKGIIGPPKTDAPKA